MNFYVCMIPNMSSSHYTTSLLRNTSCCADGLLMFMVIYHGRTTGPIPVSGHLTGSRNPSGGWCGMRCPSDDTYLRFRPSFLYKSNDRSEQKTSDNGHIMENRHRLFFFSPEGKAAKIMQKSTCMALDNAGV